jgi:hypothetical protein
MSHNRWQAIKVGLALLAGLEGNNMWKRFAQCVIALLGLSTALMFQVPGALAAPAKKFGQTPPSPGNMVQFGPFKVLDISDDYARQMVMKYGDPSVAAHMKVRIKQPLPDQEQTHKIFSASPTPSETPTWEGYDADVLNTPWYTTLIRAHFVAQQTSCSCTVGEWVGLGGVHGTANLFQVGVDMGSLYTFLDVIQPGYSPYAVDIFSVLAGDDIYAQISWDNKTNLWYYLIDDVTHNLYNSNEMGVNPDQNSAEWIVEVANPTHPIPVFSGVHFTHALFGISDGETGNITSSIAQPTYEAYIGPVPYSGCWARPGPVSSDGYSFYAYDFC